MANGVAGEGQPQYEPLPIHLTPEGQAISCWQLSEEEKARVAETGQIWLVQLTFNGPLQPVYITADDLFTTVPDPPAQQEGAQDGIPG